MLAQETLTELVESENVDAVNLVYWELPAETQRIIDRMVAKSWGKEVSELEEF